MPVSRNVTALEPPAGTRVCDARLVDWVAVAAFAGLGVLLAIAVSAVVDRGRRLDAIRTLTAADETSEDLDVRVRHLQERVRASESELDQRTLSASYLADIMGVGVLGLDDSLRVVLANPAAHILLGRAPGSIIGRSAMEVFVDTRFEEAAATARDIGGASGEFRVRGPDGPILAMRARRSPVSGVLVVLDDVTELRRLQQIRAEFVDNLSHELRTPLSTISLLAETLGRDAEMAGDAVPAKMRDRIAKIEVETGHLVQMVNELLDLARIESGGPLVLLDDIDIGRVVAESTERLRSFAERQGLRLVVDVPESMPRVRGDEARIGQVVVNLLHNAVKFSDGSDEVAVRVRADGPEVVVSVEDHGVGIPRADQGRIFERFYKVDRARVRGGGTGLGLSIARNVLQQHGGRIWVESEEGVGSTFSFALPIPATADSAH
jgi:two-component system, OmpR family, phosphate regulon sensor histidine kinase PhoR